MTASAGPVLQRLHREYGDRVAFVTVYVREAHPGEWYPQPHTFEQKLQYARDYKQRDQIPWTVAVDDLDGAFHHKLDQKPNAAYIADASGTVIMRTLWSNDERPLREGLEALVHGRRPRHPDRKTRAVPMLRGMGEMDEVLARAGDEAREDLKREAPPLYAMAKLAGIFRPLPPLGRGIAAAATGLLGIAAIAGIGWLLFRRRGR